MRLDELIQQTTSHEKTAVIVDGRVTAASRTALGGCVASAVVYHQTKADDATNLAGFLIDWAGFPAAGYFYTLVTLAVGVVLLAVTKGFTEANQQTHQTIVGFTIAAAVTVVPILLAVVVWLLLMVLIIAVFAATIGFAVLVLWALTQIN